MNEDDIRMALARHLGHDLTAYHWQFKPRVRDHAQWSPDYRTREEAQTAADQEHSRWQTVIGPVEEYESLDNAPYLTLDFVIGLARKLDNDGQHRYIRALKAVLYADMWTEEGPVPGAQGWTELASAAQCARAYLWAIDKRRSVD